MGYKGSHKVYIDGKAVRGIYRYKGYLIVNSADGWRIHKEGETSPAFKECFFLKCLAINFIDTRRFNDESRNPGGTKDQADL